jgi:hypothetical protein
LWRTWQPGDLVLWDKLAARGGAQIIRLSPSAPDCNPMEQCWAKSKTYVRRAKARIVEALIAVIKEALATLTAAEMQSWFEHGGYPVH